MPQMYFMFPTQSGVKFPHRTLTETDMKPMVQKTVSAVIGAIGLALLVMMITTEGEPGALPLGLILIGAIGYVTGRMRERSSRLP
jgi:hypothetical protein